jgi:signal transduction histidine kinase
MVSHEFRTPLTVILTASEMLHQYYDRMERDKHMERIVTINKQALSMSEMLQSVLTLSKASAGKLEFKPNPIQLGDFCQRMVEQVQHTDTGSHRFQFRMQGDFADARMDEKLLQHILINLLSNAAKYSPDETDIVFDVTRAGTEIMFRIEDHGIGIPKDDLPRLFEAFHRAGNVGMIGGTGLGLAIVKNSVDVHGGTIDVHSVQGAGTTFVVRLPLVPAADTPA